MSKTVLAASAAIFREDGKVLLATRTKPPAGKWSLPGGRNEPGESLRETAVREAREEVSVEIEIVAEVGERVVELRNESGEIYRRFAVSVFAAALISGEPVSGPEAGKVGWFNLDEIGSLDATDGLAQSVEEAARAFAEWKRRLENRPREGGSA